MIIAVSYFNNLGGKWRSLLAYSTLAARTHQSPQRKQNLGFNFSRIVSYSFQLEEVIIFRDILPTEEECKPLFTSFSPVAGTQDSSWIQFWEIARLQFESTGQLKWNCLFKSLRIWTLPNLLQMDKWHVITHPGHSACSSLGPWPLRPR